MIGRWFIGPHAIQRYAERVLGWQGGRMPAWLYRQCRAAIARASTEAARTAVQSWGVEVWRLGTLRFVVRPESAQGVLPSLLTVLPEEPHAPDPLPSSHPR